MIVKFRYSEKATKFCEIFPLLLTTVHTVKSKGKISQNFVAFSEYMNFNETSCDAHLRSTFLLNSWRYKQACVPEPDRRACGYYE